MFNELTAYSSTSYGTSKISTLRLKYYKNFKIVSVRIWNIVLDLQMSLEMNLEHGMRPGTRSGLLDGIEKLEIFAVLNTLSNDKCRTTQRYQ